MRGSTIFVVASLIAVVAICSGCSESPIDPSATTSTQPPAQMSEPNPTVVSTSIRSTSPASPVPELAPVEEKIVLPIGSAALNTFEIPPPVIAAIQSAPESKQFEISILSDNSLSPEARDALDSRRELALREQLIGFGVDAGSIFTTGVGESPVAEEPGAVLIISDKPSVSTTLDYSWNLWPREKGGLRDPVEVLRPGQTYEILLDLSGLAYNRPGIDSVTVEKEFQRLVDDKAVETLDPHLELDILLVPDPRHFKLSEPLEKLKVDLGRVRAFRSETPPAGGFDVDQAISSGPNFPFVFARAKFTVETTQRNGWAAIGLAIWHAGRPYDEITFVRCIADPGENCADDEKPRARFGGFAIFDVAKDSAIDRPEAGLHVVEFSDDLVAGIFGRREGFEGDDAEAPGVRKPYLTWILKGSADELRDTLAKEQKRFGETGDPVAIGSTLAGIFFPSGEDGDAALEAVRDFVNENAKEPFRQDRPTLFVRMTRRDGVRPLFPVGLINIDHTAEGFLGYHASIQTPLREQRYGNTGECPKQWQAVLPTNAMKGALLEAYGRVPGLTRSSAFNLNERVLTLPGAVNTPPVFSSFRSFSEWINPRIAKPQEARSHYASTVLAVLSHHNEDALYFELADAAVGEAAISAVFDGPSVAILAGCSTGNSGSSSILSRLNVAGMTSIIATNTGVTGALAGDLVALVSERLQTAGGSIEVGELFDGIQADLYSKLGYGAHTLSVTLAGDPEARICLP